MAGGSVCTNCGATLKGNMLVCKACHKALWDKITPYYLWGAIFVGGAAFVFLQLPKYLAGNDLITLMMPIFAFTFGLMGMVMLLMAIIATLRGLTVRKQ
jgi:hypothetical protein